MDYDYVIVGNEAAAYVLANRLTEYSANTVLLLEATSTEPPGAIGAGTGVLDLSGHQFDFDRWRHRGCEGWGDGDVLPYFRRAASSWRGEDVYHRTSRSRDAGSDGARMHDVALLHRALLTAEVISRDASTHGAADLFIRDHGAASASQVYLHPALQRYNLRRETGARIDRIILEGRRAAGVVYQLGGIEQVARARCEVIVSSGSYASPQLLLRSGIGPAGALAVAGIAPLHDLPGVGQNLSAKIMLGIRRALVRPEGFHGAPRADHRADVGAPPAQRTSADDAHLVGLPVQLCSRSDGRDADVALAFAIVARTGGSASPALECTIALIDPQGRGEVGLTSARDDDGRQRLDLLATDEDRAAARAGVRLARRVLDAAPLRDLIELELSPKFNIDDDAELDAFVQRAARASMRPVGTCAMGTSPLAVVDAALRVHGLTGLRVVDASVMPSLPGGDTEGPTIMIAERAADLVAGRPTLMPVAPETR